MSNKSTLNVDASDVELAANQIARRDFRVQIGKYITRDAAPWVITIGELTWKRHVVALGKAAHGGDVELGVLSYEQSAKTDLYEVDVSDIDRRIMVSELVAEGYVGVKRVLAMLDARSV